MAPEGGEESDDDESDDEPVARYVEKSKWMGYGSTIIGFFRWAGSDPWVGGDSPLGASPLGASPLGPRPSRFPLEEA